MRRRHTDLSLSWRVLYHDTGHVQARGHQSEGPSFGEERNEISAVSGDKNGIAMFRLFISPAGVSSQVMSAKIFLATLPNHVKTFFTFFQLGLPTHNPRVKVTYIFPVLVKPC